MCGRWERGQWKIDNFGCPNTWYDSLNWSIQGVLSFLLAGALDDGRGRARVGLFRHKHELETGRTSSVGMEVCICLLKFTGFQS